MPYRSAAGLLMALGGLVAVAGLVLIGVDVCAASKRGPRWKRRLLGAGLVLVGALGGWFARPKPPVMTCYMTVPPAVASALQLRDRLPLLEKMVAEEKLDAEVARLALAAAETDLGRLLCSKGDEGYPGTPPSDVAAIQEQAAPVVARLRARLGEPELLEETAEWKALAATWDEAAAALVPKPGKFAFDLETKRRLVTAMDYLLSRDLDRLAGAGLLLPSEALLLKADLAEILDGVRRTRASGNDPTPTCYGPGIPVPAARKSERDLAARVDALKELASSGRLHAAAVRRVLVSVRADLAVLDEEGSYAGMAPEKRAEIRKTRDAVKAEVDKLRKLLDGGKQPPINAGGGK